MKKILILPDIHGRDFWIEPCSNYQEFDEIIFLGDYLDPYSFEGITSTIAYNNFLEILDFAKSTNNVTMLIGNHDWHYFVFLDSCRIDKARERDIEKSFLENLNLFRLTKTIELENCKYLFSHAGITKKWLDDIAGMAKYEVEHWNPGDVNPETDEDYQWIKEISKINQTYNFELFEKCLSNYNDNFYSCLPSMISRGRGGYYPNGSMIWADIEEHIYNEDLKGYFQIFAHTNTYPKCKPIIPDGKNWAMLDASKAFILDSEGNIEPYGN